MVFSAQCFLQPPIFSHACLTLHSFRHQNNIILSPLLHTGITLSIQPRSSHTRYQAGYVTNSDKYQQGRVKISRREAMGRQADMTRHEETAGLFPLPDYFILDTHTHTHSLTHTHTHSHTHNVSNAVAFFFRCNSRVLPEEESYFHDDQLAALIRRAAGCTSCLSRTTSKKTPATSHNIRFRWSSTSRKEICKQESRKTARNTQKAFAAPWIVPPPPSFWKGSVLTDRQTQ